jgi:hypothetical protein
MVMLLTYVLHLAVSAMSISRLNKFHVVKQVAAPSSKLSHPKDKM